MGRQHSSLLVSLGGVAPSALLVISPTQPSLCSPRYGGGSFSFSRLISSVTQRFSTEFELQQVRPDPGRILGLGTRDPSSHRSRGTALCCQCFVTCPLPAALGRGVLPLPLVPRALDIFPLLDCQGAAGVLPWAGGVVSGALRVLLEWCQGAIGELLGASRVVP